MSERLSAEERDIRDLTLAILHFYGYTDADIAEAEAVHPGRVCREEECYDEDGRSVHPGAYDELGGTASTVVEVIAPFLTARLASRDARLAAVVDWSALGLAVHSCAWRTLDHDSPECPCDMDTAHALSEWLRAALHHDPSEAGA